jgi:hypothetical protein
MQAIGGYKLGLTIGGTYVPLQAGMVQELTITQDIDQLLPSFKMTLREPTGILGEIVPHDKDANSIGLKITGSLGEEYSNEFQFLVKRRRATFEKQYSIEGILNVIDLLDPPKSRALTGNVYTSISDIVSDELKIPDAEIGQSLQYSKTIIQPWWTNAQLLRFLKGNLLGINGQSGYYCFIKNIRSLPIFVFKSLDEIVEQSVAANFMIGHKQYEDFYPVVDYQVLDSSQLISQFSAKQQSYAWFDYATGVYKSGSVGYTEYPSLSEQFLIDEDNDTQGTLELHTGRSNDFHEDFEGKIKSKYYGALTGLVSMWISAWGNESLAPGDVVKVVFNEAFASGDFYLYQHSGYWLVKRVVHVLGSSFLTNILLTRSGIDSSIENTLIMAERSKRND